MELENIKELVELMKLNDLSELEIVDGQTRIVLKRTSEQLPPQVVAMTPTLAVNGSAAVMQATPTESGQAQGPVEDKEEFGQIVAPMVGTFYTAPSPNAEPFLQVGSKLEKESVVGIIEAMKVMNEIKSEISGTIKKILVSDGAAVEYGQPLFLVEPD